MARHLFWLPLLLLIWHQPTESRLTESPPPEEVRPKDEGHHPPPADPVSSEQLEKVMARGVDYLCRTQNADGSWGSPRWTGGVDTDPVPGAFHSFGTAVTAMCLEALLSAGDSPRVRQAAERAEVYLLENLPKLRRADRGNLPNVWGYCYGIQVLAELHRRAPPDSERRRKLEEMIRAQMDGLKRFETVHGGWFYYAGGLQRPLAPSCSFVNAAVLVALHRAKGLGPCPDDRVLKRAIESTAEQRKPDSSYLYSISSPLQKGYAMAPINRPAGSLGRSQACNLALRLWGDKRITDEVLKEWLDRLITRNGWLDMGRKRPIPHESFAQVAGYFFYFGHYYGALCIRELPEADRPFYQDHLARLLMRLQEEDGSWWDYPLYSYHKPYGTAFALMSLQCCRKALAADGNTKPEPAKSFKNKIGMTMVPIRAGSFLMGSTKAEQDSVMKEGRERLKNDPKIYWKHTQDMLDSEGPQHEVRFSKRFSMGAYPVTVGQFRQFVAETKYQTDAERNKDAWTYNAEKKRHGPNPQGSWRVTGWEQTDRHPVVNVSWDDAMAFCSWLSKKEGKTYRLPTEAEWEYACRAGTTTRYCFGDAASDLKGRANIADRALQEKFDAKAYKYYTFMSWDDGYPFTSPVDRFPPNAWGLYDMHGNVCQWCLDWFDKDDHYGTHSRHEAPPCPKGSWHLMRGGSWYVDALSCRAAWRYCATGAGGPWVGFRVVLIPNGASP